MNLPYLIPRVIRHFMPDRLTRFLLLRSVFIRPGLETADPETAVQRYAEALDKSRSGLRGKRILVFGYGGRFDIGIRMLEAGAAHVALCDPFARPDDQHNATLLPAHAAHLSIQEGHPRPRSNSLELIESDVRQLEVPPLGDGFDLVVSTSVYEHVDDPASITRSLARLTNPDGWQVHFVDLRDHFFKYPFEMLTFSPAVWRRWLNPSTNHNRLRLWEYRGIFEDHFDTVTISILARDEEAFKRIQDRVRSEFKSGRPDEDAATLIRIIAGRPKR